MHVYENRLYVLARIHCLSKNASANHRLPQAIEREHRMNAMILCCKHGLGFSFELFSVSTWICIFHGIVYFCVSFVSYVLMSFYIALHRSYHCSPVNYKYFPIQQVCKF